MLGMHAGFDMALDHARDGGPQIFEMIDVLRISEDCIGEAARLFAAFLRGRIKHRLHVIVLEQALVHRGGDVHPVLLDHRSGGLDDGAGMFGSGAHGVSPIQY